MGMFDWGSEKSKAVVHVDGTRDAVLVTGLGYKRDQLPAAFGALERISEYDFVAELKPQDPNEYNRTPIEVWVNSIHIGYVCDQASPNYWATLRGSDVRVTCGCVVKTDGTGGINKVRLSLPPRLSSII